MSDWTRDEARQYAREKLTESVITDAARQGKYVSEEKARAYANERGDLNDKKNDLKTR